MNVLHKLPGADATELHAETAISGAQVIFRTQDGRDRMKLHQLCPIDQTCVLVGRWDGVHFIVEHAPAVAPAAAPAVPVDPGVEGGTRRPSGEVAAEALAARRKELLGTDPKKLRTLAGELEVKWDGQASPETMVARIMSAEDKAASAAAGEKPGT